MSTHRKLMTVCFAAVFALGLAACSSSDDDPPMTNGDGDGMETPDPAIAQRADIKMKIDAAQTAVNAVNNDSSDAVVSAADAAVSAAEMAIAAGTNVPAAEKAANSQAVAALEAQLAGAKTARMTAMDDAKKAKDAMMMATAMKLHDGIGAPMGDGTGVDDRHAAYGTGDNAGKIAVTYGDGTAAGTAVNLSEDKKTMVAANHGWMGKKYTKTMPAADGMYEAVVYSNVGKPTEGAKFSVEYTLSDGMVTVDTTQDGEPAKVASTRFDQSAGMKMFKLPDPNPQGATKVTLPGSYHGVSGTYTCTPTNASSVCTSTVAASGFTLTGGTWMFKPGNPDAKVTSTKDMIYASYGWWIHKSADGKTFTASAFVDDMGDVPDATGITNLRGTATYMGGAAGKYALYSSTGGTNDAGHFTAKAMLEADFNDDMITGTIDSFMGADGMSRDWSVELKETVVGDTGAITEAMTVWTIDGTAAAAAGSWSGSLQDNGDDGVPKVGTGTFYSMYSTSGKMVGAFGVNKQ